MAQTLTLLHGADLHLGAPLRGVGRLTEAWRARVLDAITKAFERLVDAALRNQVDFVVIAGDMFDQAKPSLHDLECVLAGLERLSAASIPVYLCGGNHDPFTVWQNEKLTEAMPPNVHIFDADKPSFFLYERDGAPLCVLAGRSYYSKIWPSDASISAGLDRASAIRALGERAQAAPFGVGVLHTGLDLDTIKAPASRAALQHAGFDYWALGHIHRRFIDDERDSRLAFSGCIQGRDLREVGRRGVNLVTLSEGAPANVRFVPTAQIAMARLSVDVSLCSSIADVKDKVMAALFAEDGNALCEMMISRVFLEGTCELHRSLRDERVREELRRKINDSYDDFFCDAIVDRTIDPEVEAERASAAGSVVEIGDGAIVAGGDLVLERTVEEAPVLFPATLARAATEQRRQRVDEIAFLQEEFAQLGLEFDGVSGERVDWLADEAERLGLDLLNASEEALS